ncbi:MAG TPA: 1,4-alpha-glucan branching enzyme, partial [Candidatus Methylomirabilis sp.]|nr:1,4-alpha-glucan branching enzyme [Candidatus Methylomirabilis sp.]
MRPPPKARRSGGAEARAHPVRTDISLLTDEDLYLFNEGTHSRLAERLGAHPVTAGGEDGVFFAVWAPDAERVFVMGDFNGWDTASHPLRPRGQSGIWEGFVAGVTRGTAYKYHVVSRYGGYRVDKADPFALYAEAPPRSASIVWDLEYRWGDREWMATRRSRN